MNRLENYKKMKSLRKENNILDDQIKEENQDAFTDIICYLRGAQLADYDTEVVRNDISEMIISAQNRGEGIKSVIGNDYKEFCDNIIANVPRKTRKQKLFEYVDIVFTACAMVIQFFASLVYQLILHKLVF